MPRVMYEKYHKHEQQFYKTQETQQLALYFSHI